MKKYLLILTLACLWLAGCTSTPTVAVVMKTPGPVDVEPVETLTPSPTPVGTADMAIKIVIGGSNPHIKGAVPAMLSLTPNVEAPNTNVTITLPSETSITQGTQAWAGDLKANQGLYLNLLLQIDALSKPGVIQVDSVSYPKDFPKLSKTYYLYVRPTADGLIEFSETPFKP